MLAVIFLLFGATAYYAQPGARTAEEQQEMAWLGREKRQGNGRRCPF